MNYEEVRKEIEAIFFLVQNQITTKDECFVQLNNLRKEMNLAEMSKEEFDSKFLKKPETPK